MIHPGWPDTGPLAKVDPNTFQALRNIQRETTTFRYAHVWKVTPVHPLATPVYFTDFNYPIEFDGDTYSPKDSLIPSARSFSTEPGNNGCELRGGYLETGFTKQAVRKDWYAGAQVLETLLDWRYPFLGPYRQHLWVVANTTGNDREFRLLLVGQALDWTRPNGDTFKFTCRNNLGDSWCQVDINSTADQYRDDVAVSSVVDDRSHFEVDSIYDRPDDWWKYGTVVWETGPNAGTVQDVQRSRKVGDPATSHFVQLLQSTEFDISVGDTAILRVGCDWLIQTCKDKFDNVPNARAFPHMVGRDRGATRQDESQV